MPSVALHLYLLEEGPGIGAADSIHELLVGDAEPGSLHHIQGQPVAESGPNMGQVSGGHHQGPPRGDSLIQRLDGCCQGGVFCGLPCPLDESPE